MTKNYRIMTRLTQQFVRTVPLATAVALCAVLAFGIWRSLDQQEKRTPPYLEGMDAQMKLTDMEYTEIEDGRQIWKLNAAEARYFQQEQKTLLTDVELVLYLEDDRRVQLHSQHGVLYADSKNIELSGMVRAIVPEGYEMATEQVRYFHAPGTVSSDTPIRIFGPLGELTGAQWHYDINTQKAVVDGKVEAVFKPSVGLNQLQ